MRPTGAGELRPWGDLLGGGPTHPGGVGVCPC
nr:MAG TPA_asm: hypothetical protein [Caudoviricetes sp.]